METVYKVFHYSQRRYLSVLLVWLCAPILCAFISREINGIGMTTFDYVILICWAVISITSLWTFSIFPKYLCRSILQITINMDEWYVLIECIKPFWMSKPQSPLKFHLSEVASYKSQGNQYFDVFFIKMKSGKTLKLCSWIGGFFCGKDDFDEFTWKFSCATNQFYRANKKLHPELQPIVRTFTSYERKSFLIPVAIILSIVDVGTVVAIIWACIKGVSNPMGWAILAANMGTCIWLTIKVFKGLKKVREKEKNDGKLKLLFRASSWCDLKATKTISESFELKPKYSCGEFILGEDIDRYLHLSHTVEQEEGEEHTSYDFYGGVITVCTTKDKHIESIRCDAECYWNRRNLIGMLSEEFLAEVGHKPNETHIVHVSDSPNKKGQNHKVYEFESLGLYVWTWRKKIISILLS